MLQPTIMLQIPRIALYKLHDDDAHYISACFPREEYSIRVVESPEQITALVADESAQFDAIVLPPKGRDGDGGLMFCERVRKTPDLDRTPIVALTDDASPHIVGALYDSGADAVITAPFNPRTIFFQINALHRLRNSYEGQITRAFELSGLRQTTAKALNCSREGVLLFDPNGILHFLNTAAGRQLGVGWDTPGDDIDRIAQQFAGFIEQHEGVVNSNSAKEDAVSALPMSITRASISRLDGRQFSSIVRVLTLAGERGELYGHAVVITDLSEYAVLAAQVEQAHRTRSLCLAAAAGCLHLARGSAPIRASSAASLFEEIGKTEQPPCSCASISTAFLETLDLMIRPEINVKVNLNRDVPLALKPGELFQILGHLVLEGIDFCGASGEIEIDTNEMPEFKSIRLSVIARSNRTVPPEPMDHVSALLQGSSAIAGETEGALPYGLAAAHEILKRHGATPVSQEHPTDTSLLLRVLLPLA